ncbi:uncharacterized protein LOC123446304 [Hordeum vulgare subsp. vulgare]|uniref:Predicted protein n=1 Tax=Hordeum vulgare subsp. vulgare TaxID=112509 RepID=F2ED54_HORVV|nr:uncharacterized protein LOC123446304 [Hordeum vulgare subsp. vulgare]BAK05276.1 predicted protein [Hordeum vulgare subsp. vulgare]
MKPSMSRKKRKASEGKCTNPKSKRRLNKDKQPSPGSLPIEKNKQPSHGSLPIEKNKQPSLSKKVMSLQRRMSRALWMIGISI